MSCSIRKDCRLCGDELSGPLLDLGETPVANNFPRTPDELLPSYPLYVVQCLGCGHVQLPVVVDQTELFKAAYPYQSSTAETFRKHLTGFAKDVSERIGGKGRILEIGSNDGTLLKEFQKLGHEVLGIEPAAEVATGAIAEGVPTLAKFYPCSLNGPLHDAVVSLNVFAHIDDIARVFEHIATYSLLRDGILVFEVGYWPDVLMRQNLGVVYHEHLSYHTLGPLRRVLQKHAMNLFDAKRVDSQQGSIRVYVEGGPRPASKYTPMTERLRTLLYRESRADLSPERLAPAVERTKRCLGPTSLLSAAREAVRIPKNLPRSIRICGYGAPAKLTTICSVAGLTYEHIECVFDDNPKKIGRYTPAGRIPIVSSVELYERNPDVILLFSSNFADEIKARFPEYRGQWWTV